MVGLVISDLDRLLTDWLRHQGKTLQDWAIALHGDGFMNDNDIKEVECVLDAAANRGAWEMDDPLTVAHEFLTVARRALVINPKDEQMHQDIAIVLYDHLCPKYLGVPLLP